MSIETIAIAADHAGFELKSQLGQALRERGLEVLLRDFPRHERTLGEIGG